MRTARRIIKAENGIEQLSRAFDLSESAIIEMFEQELVHFKTYDCHSESNKIIEELKSTFTEL